VFRVLDDARWTPRLLALAIDEGPRPVVFVGGFSPHKNLALLVSAFDAVAERFPGVKLVLAGDPDGGGFTSCSDDLRSRVARLSAPARVVFAGHLDDDDLVVLLNRAAVLVLPSWMEGFGLPAVEAAACACPVIATTESPLAGLLGDGVLSIRPEDRAGLEAALARVLGDDAWRARMSAAALAAARRMSWDDAARRLKGVIEACGAAAQSR
jgi:glycosyltransferase involved in cell wall biosynthesis